MTSRSPAAPHGRREHREHEERHHARHVAAEGVGEHEQRHRRDGGDRGRETEHPRRRAATRSRARCTRPSTPANAAPRNGNTPGSGNNAEAIDHRGDRQHGHRDRNDQAVGSPLRRRSHRSITMPQSAMPRNTPATGLASEVRGAASSASAVQPPFVREERDETERQPERERKPTDRQVDRRADGEPACGDGTRHAEVAVEQCGERARKRRRCWRCRRPSARTRTRAGGRRRCTRACSGRRTTDRSTGSDRRLGTVRCGRGAPASRSRGRRRSRHGDDQSEEQGGERRRGHPPRVNVRTRADVIRGGESRATFTSVPGCASTMPTRRIARNATVPSARVSHAHGTLAPPEWSAPVAGGRTRARRGRGCSGAARSLPVPAQTLVARSAQYGLRSSRLRILPEPVFGNSSIHEIERGTL